MKINLGVMQGRLSPQYKNLIQHYPLRSWKNEFKIAKEIGIKHIEWIFEYPNYKKNVISLMERIENEYIKK